MRVTRNDLQTAIEQVRQAFTPEVLGGLEDNDLFPRELLPELQRAQVDEYNLAVLHQLIAGPVAVVNIALRADRAAGINSSFAGEANLIRAAHFTGDLRNQEALGGLFPELSERYEPADAATLRGGIGNHLVERFTGNEAEGQASTLHGQLMRVAVQRAAQTEGEVYDAHQALAVAGEEVGVDQMLLAVAALRDVVNQAQIPLAQGLSMLGAGLCEFNVGLSAVHEAIRQVYPGSDEQAVDAMTERTINYLRQFSGQVVNQVIQEVGNEWLRDHGQDYLAQMAADGQDYDGDDDLDGEFEPIDEPGDDLGADDTFDFRI
jgi:hypothetical protein